MGIFSKLFSRKDDDKKVGGMEDYMTLVSVYFQAALASQLGITNLAMLARPPCLQDQPPCSYRQQPSGHRREGAGQEDDEEPL